MKESGKSKLQVVVPPWSRRGSLWCVRSHLRALSLWLELVPSALCGKLPLSPQRRGDCGQVFAESLCQAKAKAEGFVHRLLLQGTRCLPKEVCEGWKSRSWISLQSVSPAHSPGEMRGQSPAVYSLLA